MAHGAHDWCMQLRERFFERGHIPVAALVFVALLGVGLFAFDSAQVAVERRSQVAQARAATTQPTKRCVNDSRYIMTIGTSQDARPEVRGDQLQPRSGTAEKNGCWVSFCVGRTPTENNIARETCTEERYFADDKAVQAASSNNLQASQTFANTIQSSIGNEYTGSGAPESLKNLNLSQEQTDAINRAFSAGVEQQQNAVELAQAEYDAMLAARVECGALGTCVGQAQRELEASNKLDAERMRLEAMQREAQSLQATQSSLSAGRGSEVVASRDAGIVDTRFNTQSTLGSDNPDPSLSTEERDRLARECADNRSSDACRRLQEVGPYRGPNDRTLFERLFGGSSPSAGQSYCVVQTYPSTVISPEPWRPGCLNSPNGQQQCSAIQQMISGCRSPYTGQQQCGGLLLMLNKCPAGSYNPNNPSNPYNYPTPTCTIQASPANAQAGQPVMLQWQSQNASYAYLSDGGQVGPSGTKQVVSQGPTTYTLTVVGYGNQQGRCQTQPGGGTGTGGPTAEISCQPQTADVGSEIAVSFACQNSATSGGSGFSTNGEMSGSRTLTMPQPQLGQHTVTYGLTCSNQGQVHSAQCTININKAAIVLVANPKTVKSGAQTTIGWVTSGMESCSISSSNAAFNTTHASSTGTAGSAKTPALTESTSFTLVCETKTGATKTASTTVPVE